MYDEKEIAKLMDIAVLADLDLGSAARLPDHAIAEIYNGCGPEWLREAARQKLTKYLGVFGPGFAIHDVDYHKGDGSTFDFAMANDRLEANCLKLADYSYGPLNWRRYVARAAAVEIASLCRRFGWPFYLDACKHS